HRAQAMQQRGVVLPHRVWGRGWVHIHPVVWIDGAVVHGRVDGGRREWTLLESVQPIVGIGAGEIRGEDELRVGGQTLERSLVEQEVVVDALCLGGDR